VRDSRIFGSSFLSFPEEGGIDHERIGLDLQDRFVAERHTTPVSTVLAPNKWRNQQMNDQSVSYIQSFVTGLGEFTGVFLGVIAGTAVTILVHLYLQRRGEKG
jgi:hypothetical protein